MNDCMKEIRCICCGDMTPRLRGSCFCKTEDYFSEVHWCMSKLITTIFVCDHCLEDALDTGLAKETLEDAGYD